MSAVQPSKYFHIDKFSHHFVVKNMSPSGVQITERFVRQYIQFGMVKVGRFYKRGALRVFAAKIASKGEIRLHIGQYKAFRAYLADIAVPDHGFTEAEYGFVDAAPLDCEITKEKTPRDYQVTINEYNMSPMPSRRKFVGIPPGKGKTFVACWFASQLNKRIVGFLKPKYLKKWPGDLEELLGMSKDDVEMVAGSVALMDVIDRALNGTLTAKAILVSNRTFQNWMSLYEEKGDAILQMGYGCTPEQFCQVIQAGLRIIDEVHEDFHCNFKIDLYTHIEWSISLSATLIADDQFLRKMQEIAYPVDERCQVKIESKYVLSYAMRFHMVDAEKFQTTERGSINYSHIAFERNFFEKRFSWLLPHYLEFINDRFMERFLTRYEPGQKCLIYAASIQMCTAIMEYLKKKHPDLDVRRYVEEDPYDNLMNATVCCSTIQSAGTGHDIKGLIVVILTNSINASASNIQGHGRLREIPGVDVEFEYLTCLQVDKQMEYHVKKELLLAEKSKQCTLLTYPYTVGES